MSAVPSTPAPVPPAPAAVGPAANLRLRGVVILVLVLVEILLGNQLAVAGSPYPIAYLVVHILVAVLVCGFAGHIVLLAWKRTQTPIRVAAAITFLSAVGATLGGTWFLVGGMSNPALYTMEALGGLAFLGAILVIVLGGPAPAPKPVAA